MTPKRNPVKNDIAVSQHSGSTPVRAIKRQSRVRANDDTKWIMKTQTESCRDGGQQYTANHATSKYEPKNSTKYSSQN